MVAFLICGFRSSAISPALVGQHGFANMNAAVINQVNFGDFVAGVGDAAADGFAEQIVANVAEVLGFVGIW